MEAAQRNPSLLDASKTPWVEDKSGEGDAVAGDVVARLFVKAKDEHGIQVRTPTHMDQIDIGAVRQE